MSGTNVYECYYDPKFSILRDKKTGAEVRVPLMQFIKMKAEVQKEKSNIMGLCTAAYTGAIVVTGTGDPNKMLDNVTWRLKAHDASDDIDAAQYSENATITKEEWNQNSDGRRKFL